MRASVRRRLGALRRLRDGPCALHPFVSRAVKHGVETLATEEAEQPTAHAILPARSVAYPPSVPRPLPFALCLVLVACGTEPTAPPPDAPAPDVAPEAAAEVGVDVGLDAPADQPVEAGPDAAPDVVVEVGVDAAEETPLDVSAPDGAEDHPVEAGPDVAPDAPPACTAGTTRCPAGPEGIALEYCVSGMWLPSECSGFGLAGATGVCSNGDCYVCRRADGGAGCAAEPLCAADADCFRLGLGRCASGRCARRGALRCASNTDCGPWRTSTTFASCGESPRFGGAMTCGGFACTHDEMCPSAFRCDIGTGYCVAR